MTQNTKVWLHGLGAAFIGAAANSAGAMLVAPDRFNLTSVSGLRNTALASIISGGAAVCLYLKTSPLPPVEVKTESAKQVSVSPDGALTATETSTTTTTEAK